MVHLGFEVRVEMTLGNGENLSVQLTRDQADELELREGQTVFARPRATKIFPEDQREVRKDGPAVDPAFPADQEAATN